MTYRFLIPLTIMPLWPRRTKVLKLYLFRFSGIISLEALRNAFDKECRCQAMLNIHIIDIGASVTTRSHALAHMDFDLASFISYRSIFSRTRKTHAILLAKIVVISGHHAAASRSFSCLMTRMAEGATIHAHDTHQQSIQIQYQVLVTSGPTLQAAYFVMAFCWRAIDYAYFHLRWASSFAERASRRAPSSLSRYIFHDAFRHTAALDFRQSTQAPGD